MAHGLTGSGGTVTWGGGVINGKVQDWAENFSAETVSDRGAGEDWESLLMVKKDWEVTFNAFALDQADWSPSSATSEAALIGVTTTIALKRKSSDTNPHFTATGMTTAFSRTHPIEGTSAFSVTVRCSEGVAPTIDTTPA